MIEGDHDGGWRRTGKSGHDFPGATSGLEHQVGVLSWAKRGDLRGRHSKTDPSYWIIPPPWSTYQTWRRP